MFSVVIPLYNKQDHIDKTITSVLKQTFTNFEVLVVDDGSTDYSLQKVEAFNDERIKTISSTNNGVSVARNTGIIQASYSWIAFLDADDWWAPTYLEEMAMLIARYPDKNLFASGRSHVFKDRIWRYTNRALPKEKQVGELNHFKVISKGLPALHASSAVINKAFLEHKGTFRPNMKMHEDHELWLRLAVNESIVFLNKPLSFYNKMIEDAASSKFFRFVDFKQMVCTISEVNDAITIEERGNFSKYYQQFCMLSYLKYMSAYTREEQKELCAMFTSLLTKTQLNILRLENTYGLATWYLKLKNRTK